jgi:hypothetical protein
MIQFISTLVTSSLNHTYYNAISDLHTFLFTVVHALGFSVFTSRILATGLKSETSTSNHYEVFLPFLVQSPWNLETQLKTPSSNQSHIATDGQSNGGSWPDIYYYSYLTVTVLFFWGALSDERTGLSFVHAAGPRQRSLSRVRVPLDSWPYFTVSNFRLPFSSPRTTRRVTVDVFDPAFTRVQAGLHYIAAAWTTQKTWLRCRPHRKHKSRDSYLASPLACWLLPGNKL